MSEVQNQVADPQMQDKINEAINDAKIAKDHAAVKSAVHSIVKTKYHEFVAFLKTYPLHSGCFMEAVRYFDLGSLWIKESIELMELKVQKVEEELKAQNDPA